jgi:HlyD family secretion protein
MNRKWLWAGAALALTGAAVAVTSLRSKGTSATRFETAEVTRGPLSAKVTATGTASALVTVQVGSQVSGRIQEILVDYNSPVKKGQLIARIDPQLLVAAVEQGRANRAAAAANLVKAKVEADQTERNFQRQKALADKQLIAAADLDTAESAARSARAQVAAAEATIEQIQAGLHQAEINLAYTSIISPINGVVISRNVDVGQTVAASLQAPTLFTIAEDLTRMQVDTNVAEADVGKLSPGGQATFTVDAFPQQPFIGRIRQIRNAPINVQNVVTYDAVIDVENPELKLRPGMTANVTVVYAQTSDALRVPNAALRFRPPPGMRPSRGDGGVALAAGRGAEGSRPAVPGHKEIWVLRDGAPVPVRVQVGITDGTLTEVKGDGLQAGDKVITDASGGTNSPAGPPPFRRMF